MNKKRVIIFIMTFLIIFTVPAFAEDGGSSFGVLSLLPPILAIVLAFLTKQVFLSLLLGILSGAILVNGGNVFNAFLRTLDTYILGSLADGWHAGIIIFTLTIGGMVGIVGKMGGTIAIANALSKKASTARGAQTMTALMGCVIFFDDLANTLIVGSTMRPLTDKMNVSREKLSYLVDSTAAPVAGIAVISTWVGYEIGLISDIFMNMGVEANFFMVYIKSIPFSFYNIFTLILIFTMIYQKRDFGPMYDAEKRARLSGKVLADGAKPMSSEETDFEVDDSIELRVSNAIVPIFTLIILTFLGLWYSGYSLGEGSIHWTNIRDCFGNADTSIALIWAAVVASIVAGVMAVTRKIMNIGEVFDAWITGGKSLYSAAILLVLSWSIGEVIVEVGTADFLIQAVSDTIPGILLPIIIFAISCLVAFSTGTSWGTMSIMVPLAVPLASSYAIGNPAEATIVLSTLSAVLSGAIFGDHCSPISDTTIISSMSSGADHLDHVKTQIPYALTAAGFAVGGYLVTGLFTTMIGNVVALALGAVAIGLFVKVVGKRTDLEFLQSQGLEKYN